MKACRVVSHTEPVLSDESVTWLRDTDFFFLYYGHVRGPRSHALREGHSHVVQFRNGPFAAVLPVKRIASFTRSTTSSRVGRPGRRALAGIKATEPPRLRYMRS